MRTNIIVTVLLTLLLFISCTSSKYLPIYDTLDVNEHGSKIIVTTFEDKHITGELIAADSNRLIILADSNYIKKFDSNTAIIPTDKIKSYRLKFARSRDYLWTIPVFALATASHGLYFIFSLPLNLIVTTAVAAGTASAFKYNDKEITYGKLKMFARFPQGIPPGIDIASIK